MKGFLPVTLLFVLLASYGDAILVCAASAQEESPRPRYKDGDFWVFRGSEREGITHTTGALHGDYKVLYSGGKLRLFNIEAGQESEIPEDVKTYDVGIIKRMIGRTQDDLQYLQRFRLPMDAKLNG